MKEQYRGTNTAKQICEIKFGVASSGEMRKMSHLNVVGVNLYDTNTRIPSKYGVLDTRMGTSSKEMDCATCGKKMKECVGHCGFIDLALPCFHIGFFNNILNILQCICKSCSRILLKPEDRVIELRRSKRPNLTYLEKKSFKKQIILKCKKVSLCPYCHEYNGTVKKAALLKIIHMKYPLKKKMVEGQIVDLHLNLAEAMNINKDISTHLSKGQEMLHPDRVLELFSNMTKEDFSFLIMDSGAPQDLIVTRILAPPLIIRPSVVSDIKAGTTEDDITMRLLEIVRCNQNLVSAMESGNNIARCMEMWDFLQLQVAQLYNSQLTGIPKTAQDTTKQLRGLVQRLKGKQGRFRGNLSGKRVDFSGRTVISPDPNLRIDQVGVPVHMAKILTYPEMVTDRNKERMKKLVLNGVDLHPGANRVLKKSGIVFRPQLKYKKEIARDLQAGDIVERHMSDRDIILFNRQPSLHRLSIQAFHAKVLPHKTLRFNECCCNPFNADFDGDEMNIHLPQTEEARAEAIILMGSKSNIRSPRNGEPLIAAIQDFITGSYLLTQKDVFFDRHQAQDIASCILGPFEESVDLPPPVILKPMRLWTGKQIFSLILKPSKQCKVLINIRAKCGGKRVEDKKKLYACKSCKDTYTLKIADIFAKDACDECKIIVKNFIIDYDNLHVNTNKGVTDSSDGCDAGNKNKKSSKKENKKAKKKPIKTTPTSTTSHKTSNNNKKNNNKGDLNRLLCHTCQKDHNKLLDIHRPLLCHNCQYYHKHCRREEMDSNDNFMVLHNSDLLAGYMDKANLGSGSKSNVFFAILKCFGEDEAAAALSRLTRVSTHYMSYIGFSISIKDVTPGRQLINTKMQLLTDGYDECDVYIKQLVQGQLQLMPGCSEEETLESVLLKVLSNIREQAADACLMQLPKNNSPLVMAVSGSKGSNINISQMIACVGQQSVSGKRVPNGFEDRALPHFKRSSKDPSARGFVENSFFSSLTASEFFFHTAAGREGLVDTAVKTSETGYMQRRLMKALEDLACGYDSTVRNSENQIVQFVYGSDGLDPIAMETKYQKTKNKQVTGVEANRPIDFHQVFEQIVREHPCKDESTLSAQQIHMIFTSLLKEEAFSFMRCYKLDANSHKRKRLKKNIGEMKVDGEDGGGGKGREGEGGGKSDEGDGESGKVGRESEVLNNYPSHEKANNFGRHLQKFLNALSANLDKPFIMWNDACKHNRVTRTQLEKFLNKCYSKYMEATMSYSTAVGALAAQSIGEPGTQMTLKTFHFAGVASMNITQGVPRILEIINATKNISTPIMTCPLEKQTDKDFARLIKGRVERTCLGEVSKNIREVYHNDESFILIELETERFHLLNLELDVFAVRKAILAAPLKMKILPHDIECHGKSIITIRNSSTKGDPYFTFKQLKLALSTVVIKGIPSVRRAVMQILDSKDKLTAYELVVEGTDLRAVMTTRGIIAEKVSSNNIVEVKQALGIEAARATVIAEMRKTMGSHGISLDIRHVMLLADRMCHTGEVLGINRSGLAKMRESALGLASFEKTSDHLFEAAYHGQLDEITGVSESIIMGIPMKIGTGAFQLLHDRKEVTYKKRPLLFESPQFHLPEFS